MSRHRFRNFEQPIQRLRDFLESRGLTVKEFARLSEMSEGSLRQWVSYAKVRPGIKSRNKIESALNRLESDEAKNKNTREYVSLLLQCVEKMSNGDRRWLLQEALAKAYSEAACEIDVGRVKQILKDSMVFLMFSILMELVTLLPTILPVWVS